MMNKKEAKKYVIKNIIEIVKMNRNDYLLEVPECDEKIVAEAFSEFMNELEKRT